MSKDPRGRKPAFSAEEQAEILDLYHKRIAPNGRPYTAPMIAKLYGCSASTVMAVVNGTGTYERRKS